MKSNIALGTDGLEDVDAFWDGEKSVSSRRDSVAPAAATTPVAARRLPAGGALASPELSTPGFDFGSENASVASPPPRNARDNKVRKSMAASVGGLSPVSTPGTVAASRAAEAKALQDRTNSQASASAQSPMTEQFEEGGDASLASPLSAGARSARSATTASSASTVGTPEAIRKERRKQERKREREVERGRRERKREQERKERI
ncbi:hypothetical protein TeGR_g10623, partial [Tetraparma gracilis]